MPHHRPGQVRSAAGRTVLPLVHSTQTVSQIADQLGFEDASYFTRYFRKYVGQTPEPFRQQQARR